MEEDYPEESPAEIEANLGDAVDWYIQTYNLDRKAVERLKKRMTSSANKVYKVDGKQYLSKDEGVMAYGEVLDNNHTAEQALLEVAKFYGKDQAWVDEVKASNYLHAKAVAKHYDDHPLQEAMKEDGTFDKQIRYAKTPRNQLNRLSRSKKLHTTLTNLTDAKVILESKVEGLEAKVSVTESNLDSTRLSLGLIPLTNKEKASILKDKGFTQKFIAEHLDVGIATIKRWWNTL